MSEQTPVETVTAEETMAVDTAFGKGKKTINLPAYASVVFSNPRDGKPQVNKNKKTGEPTGRVSRQVADVKIVLSGSGIVLNRTIWADIEVDRETGEMTETPNLSLRDLYRNTDFIDAKSQAAWDDWTYGLIRENGPLHVWLQKQVEAGGGLQAASNKPRLVRTLSESELKAFQQTVTAQSKGTK